MMQHARPQTSGEAQRASWGVQQLLGMEAAPPIYVIIAVDPDGFLFTGSNSTAEWAWKRIALEAVRLSGREGAPGHLTEEREKAMLSCLLDALAIERGGEPHHGPHCPEGHCPCTECHGRTLS